MNSGGGGLASEHLWAAAELGCCVSIKGHTLTTTVVRDTVAHMGLRGVHLPTLVVGTALYVAVGLALGLVVGLPAWAAIAIPSFVMRGVSAIRGARAQLRRRPSRSLLVWAN
jgi:hypothetical protein